MAGGKLKADPLFQGLTRPAMIMGVSYLYFVINASVCMCFYINTSSIFIVLGVFPVVHAIGYMICLREPRAIELTSVKFGKTMRCINRFYHNNTNSYDAY